MKKERRLVYRVLRRWTEIARGGRMPRRNEINLYILGEDGANCLLIADRGYFPDALVLGSWLLSAVLDGAAARRRLLRRSRPHRRTIHCGIPTHC